MHTHSKSGVRMLALTGIEPSPELVRLIPEGAARRHHIVPIAEAHGRVTVAMADPDNQRALKIVRDRFGVSAYLVRSDRESIDALLNSTWSPNTGVKMRVLACEPWGLSGPEFEQYAQSVADRLQAALTWRRATVPDRKDRNRLSTLFSDGWDLIICSVPAAARLGSRSSAADACRHALAGKSDLLLVRRPRWPVNRVLFLLQGVDADLEALDWIRRLCRPKDSVATVLALVPPVPAMYSGLERMQISVAEVLSTRTKLGTHLRRIAGQLAGWQIESRLRIRQGAPDWELQAELRDGNYDLLVTCAEPHGALARFFVPDLAEFAVALSPLPVLLSAGSAAQAEG